MNERIRSLAMQSGAREVKTLLNSPPALSLNGDEIAEFAQMIVRECARIGELKEQGYQDYDPDMSVGWYMRQHFGIHE
jgi:hypothetical protein